MFLLYELEKIIQQKEDIMRKEYGNLLPQIISVTESLWLRFYVIFIGFCYVFFPPFM